MIFGTGVISGPMVPVDVCPSREKRTMVPGCSQSTMSSEAGVTVIAPKQKNEADPGGSTSGSRVKDAEAAAGQASRQRTIAVRPRRDRQVTDMKTETNDTRRRRGDRGDVDGLTF